VFEELMDLRRRYPAFVITHVPGSSWTALPMWTLHTNLVADTADELAEQMDEILAEAATSSDPRRLLPPRDTGAWIPWPGVR
jgi:hypothetical protein